MMVQVSLFLVHHERLHIIILFFLLPFLQFVTIHLHIKVFPCFHPLRRRNLPYRPSSSSGSAGDEQEGIGRSFKGVLKCEFAWLICRGLELKDSLSAADNS
jgi:hypothetical protein